MKVAGGGRPQRRDVLGKHCPSREVQGERDRGEQRAAGAPEEEILADRPDKGAFNLRGH